MFLVALFALAGGAWLLDSAVKNRNPISSLVAVVQNPGDARAVVNDANGGAFLVDRSTTGTTTNPGQNTVPGADGNSGPSATVNGAIAFCRKEIGKPYKWGATGPNSWDCSGLVFKAYASVGVSLPSGGRPTTATMLAGIASGKLKRVSKAELIPGDLVFPDAGHVQIYTGNGRVVEAPRAGKNVREVAMWGFFTAGRVKPVTGLNASASGSGM